MQCKDQPRCKAKSKQTGKQCKQVGRSVCPSCGVCRYHGCNCGSNRGAPKGNQNGLRHGLYASVADPELASLITQADGVVDLEDEIKLTRAKIARALKRAKENPKLLESSGFEKAFIQTLRTLRQLVEAQARILAQRDGTQELTVHVLWEEIQQEVEDAVNELDRIGFRLEDRVDLSDFEQDQGDPSPEPTPGGAPTT